MTPTPGGERDLRSSTQPPVQAEILASVIESLRDGIIVVDLEGTYRVFNSAAQRILGLGPVESHPTEWTRRGAVVFLRDIDAERSEAELSERWLGIVEQMSDLVVVTGEDGRGAFRCGPRIDDITMIVVKTLPTSGRGVPPIPAS